MDHQTPPAQAEAPPAESQSPLSEEPADLSSSAKGNLELLSQFKDREEAQISGMQLLIERISGFFGSPAYFAFAVDTARTSICRSIF